MTTTCARCEVLPAVGRFAARIKRPGRRATVSLSYDFCEACVVRIRALGVDLVVAA